MTVLRFEFLGIYPKEKPFVINSMPSSHTYTDLAGDIKAVRRSDQCLLCHLKPPRLLMTRVGAPWEQ